MTDVRIYQPTKNAMQSGRARLGTWVMEFEPGAAKPLDPLMGWTGSNETRSQLRLRFDSKEAALAYAKKHGLSVHLAEPKVRQIRVKNYADKFRYDRVS